MSEFYEKLIVQHMRQQKTTEAIQLMQVKNEHERNLVEERKLAADEEKMLFEAVISFSHLAIKTLTLLNGGAAVALLAFSGHLASKKSVNFSIFEKLSHSILLFGCGAGLAFVTAAFTYLAQHQFHRVNHNTFYRRTGIGFQLAAIISALSGLICFGFGLYLASKSIEVASIFPTS